jgi:predicted transcriptional regulator
MIFFDCLNYLLASWAAVADKQKGRQKRPMKHSIPVSSLLHDKSQAAVWSVSPTATVFEAIKLMAEKNIGSLPVLSAGRLVGIFTERDYTRKVALFGKSSKDTLVREIISDQIVAVTPEHSVAECMRLMTEHRVRHLPVVQNSELVGIISIGDLVNWTISSQEAAIEQMQQYISGAL